MFTFFISYNLPYCSTRRNWSPQGIVTTTTQVQNKSLVDNYKYTNTKIQNKSLDHNYKYTNTQLQKKEPCSPQGSVWQRVPRSRLQFLTNELQPTGIRRGRVFGGLQRKGSHNNETETNLMSSFLYLRGLILLNYMGGHTVGSLWTARHENFPKTFCRRVKSGQFKVSHLMRCGA